VNTKSATVVTPGGGRGEVHAAAEVKCGRGGVAALGETPHPSLLPADGEKGPEGRKRAASGAHFVAAVLGDQGAQRVTATEMVSK
jgi:hypothetical protein